MIKRGAALKDSHILLNLTKVNEDEISALKSREMAYCSTVLQQSFQPFSNFSGPS